MINGTTRWYTPQFKAISLFSEVYMGQGYMYNCSYKAITFTAHT